ncbi:MAG: hypothetical protein ACAH17_00610 [Candidatus Paceibacterota bacterium]
MSPFIFVGVFLATLVTDALWALYMMRVTDRKPFLAASYGTLIHILTAFTVISYTENYYYIIPLLTGSFMGTYLAVKYIK